MKTTSHQSNLRKGRISQEGAYYTITLCIHNLDRLLIYDPLNPELFSGVPELIIKTIQWLHNHRRVQCQGYVIMSDHIHMVIALGEKQTLSGVMNSFESYTAREINRLQNTKGRFWQKGFYDHQLRNDESLIRHLRYIYENPVRKGYVDEPQHWPYGAILPSW